MSVRTVLIRLIGFGLLGVVLWHVPLDQVVATLRRADLGLTVLAVGLMLPFFVFKSWRWQLLLRALNLSLPWSRALMLYFVGLFAGHVSPGQVGEGIKAVYLQRQGYGLHSGLASVVLDRLADLALLVLIAILGLPLLAARVGLEIPVVLPLAALAPVLLGMALLLGRRALVPVIAARVGPARIEVLVAAAAALRARLPALAALTGLAYVVHYVRYYGLLRALDVPLPPLDFVVVLTLASLVALVPISLMGIGTRDLTLVGLFNLYDLPPETALAFSMLVLITFLANLVVGFAAWIVLGPRSFDRAVPVWQRDSKRSEIRNPK